jgi:hypothetical protein
MVKRQSKYGWKEREHRFVLRWMMEDIERIALASAIRGMERDTALTDLLLSKHKAEGFSSIICGQGIEASPADKRALNGDSGTTSPEV